MHFLETGEQLCVRKKEVFYPSPWFKFIVNSSNGQVSVSRQEGLIHTKLKLLREICCWKINFLLKNPKQDILALQIPQTLKNELLHIFYLSTRFKENETENSNSDEDSI